MAIPPRLEKELQELRETFTIEVSEDADYVLMVIKEFPLGEAFNMATSDLLLKVPKAYPDASPDMFWTHEEVKYADGRTPQAAENIEDALGKKWRRFSWHRPAWNPTIDNMHGHIEFIKSRLRKND